MITGSRTQLPSKCVPATVCDATSRSSMPTQYFLEEPLALTLSPADLAWRKEWLRCSYSARKLWLANVDCNRLEASRRTSFYNFAIFLAAFSFHCSIRPHENSPYGPIKSPISFAFSLLACRCAYLAAIPCMITPLRKAANASPQSNSELGSQPATSVYHRTHWEREGSPGVCAEGQNAEFVRAKSASLGGWLAKLYGLRRFERSDKGWPMVDISQLTA